MPDHRSPRTPAPPAERETAAAALRALGRPHLLPIQMAPEELDDLKRTLRAAGKVESLAIIERAEAEALEARSRESERASPATGDDDG